MNNRLKRVLCIEGDEYCSVVEGRTYYVIDEYEKDYRIINDDMEACNYPKDWFKEDKKVVECIVDFYLNLDKGKQYEVLFEGTFDYMIKNEFDNIVAFNKSLFEEVNEPEEMTLEEVCAELGRDIKIVKK